MSDFLRWKQSGNDNFLTCTGFPRSSWRTNLNKAYTCYVEALKFADSFEDLSSIHKNLAKTHFKFSQIEDYQSQILDNLKSCVFSIDSAIQTGKYRTVEWKNEIWSFLADVELKLFEVLQNETRKDRIDHYYKIKTRTESLPAFNYRLNTELARALLNEGIDLLEQKLYKESLRLFFNVSQPLQEALLQDKSNDELNDLRESQIIQMNVAEGYRQKGLGDELFDKIIDIEDDFEIVWEAIDAYRIAVSQSKDIEMQAICYEKIGTLFHSFLKMEEKAIKYFEQTIALALSLIPRVLTSTPWYKNASEKILAHQLKKANLDDQAYAALRTKYLAELEPEIAKAKEANEKGAQALMAYLLKKYAPEKSFPTTLETKKQLQKTLLIFHPDKHKLEDDPKKYVLMTELSKLLTYQYEIHK